MSTIRDIRASELERPPTVVAAAGVELRGMVREGELMSPKKLIEAKPCGVELCLGLFEPLLRDQDGNLLRVVQLPMPGAVKYQGQRLPASYANFYIANGIVIVPTYRDPNDSEALAILRRVFPHRRVIGIDSTDLIWGLGSFHCISQQEPA